MNDKTPETGPTALEQEIATRFASLRGEEAATAAAYRQPQPSPPIVARPWTFARALPRTAAAVAVGAVAAVLIYEKPVEDPALLYAGIMQSQSLQTDALLIVSDSVLPAMQSLPQLYDLNAEADAATNTESNLLKEKSL